MEKFKLIYPGGRMVSTHHFSFLGSCPRSSSSFYFVFKIVTIIIRRVFAGLCVCLRCLCKRGRPCARINLSVCCPCTVFVYSHVCSITDLWSLWSSSLCWGFLLLHAAICWPLKRRGKAKQNKAPNKKKRKKEINENCIIILQRNCQLTLHKTLFRQINGRREKVRLRMRGHKRKLDFEHTKQKIGVHQYWDVCESRQSQFILKFEIEKKTV